MEQLDMTTLEKYKKSAAEIFDRLVIAMKSPEGYVHPQSLLCCIGSLAGFSCQEDVRRLYLNADTAEQDVFTVFEDKAGRKYFYGDIIDQLLVGNTYSVWAFTAGVLKRLEEPYTDVGEMLRYTAANAGGQSFGKVRNCTTGETVQGYIKLLWKALLPIAEKTANSGDLHVIFGLCAQRAIMTCKSAITVSECARIIMESALTGARLDYKDL